MSADSEDRLTRDMDGDVVAILQDMTEENVGAVRQS